MRASVSVVSSRASSRALGAEHVHAPKHRRGAHRGEEPGRAALELQQNRGDVARVGRRFARKTFRIHRGDGAGEIDEGVDEMQPGAGHAAARRFARIVAPAAFDAGGVLVAEVTFDVQHLADRATGDDALELAHRGKAALVVAEPEHDFGVGDCGDGPLGFRARQRQRLLAPHRLARRRHRADLRDVQRMRRRQKHRLHARIGDRIGKFRAQFKTVGLWRNRQRARALCSRRE